MKLPNILLLFIIYFLLIAVFSSSAFAFVIPDGGGGGGGGASLEKFQEVLVECVESGTTAQECFIGGPEQMQFEAASGIFTNNLNAISTAILGPLKEEYVAQAPPGAIRTAGSLIANMYGNPPASSVQYFADLGRNLGIVKPAYAQGIGFIGLNPVLELWKAFRNIAYLFFVVIFVFVGFAIMFRLKIDPQTVISIQNALPKIIMALILVTFSYAIAGLLVDLIYVFISLIFALLKTVPEGETLDISRNVFFVVEEMFGGIWTTGVAKTLGDQINDLVSGIFTGLGGQILGFGVGALATAVFAIAIAFSLFRLFFSLLISYVSIILGTIFSPLVLMLEALPGQRGLGNWLKLMLSNIIVFPVTAGILAIAVFLTQGKGEGEIWLAPFLGGVETPIEVPILIGVGMLVLAPSIVDSVKKAIGAPGIAGMAAGIVQPLGAAAGVVAAPVRFITQPILEASQKARGEEMARSLKLPGWGRIPERE